MRKVAFACTNAGPITENERKFHERVYRNNRDMEVGFSIMYKEGFNEVFFGTTRSSDALPACKGITVETSPIFSNTILSGEDEDTDGHLMAKTPVVQVMSTTGSLERAAMDVTPEIL